MTRLRHLRFPAVLALSLIVVGPGELFAWGGTGHRVTGRIAHDHLSAAARVRVEEVLGGAHLDQVTVWADFVRAESSWGFASSWHYTTVPDDTQPGEVLADASLTPEVDDVLEAIEFLIAVLEGGAEETEAFSRILTDAEASLYAGTVEGTALALLSHFVGDLHQPLHVGNGDDRGGNSITVKWFGEEKNLHSVWDSGMIEREGLSYSELSEFLEREFVGDAELWSQGEAVDWALESKLLRQQEVYVWGQGRSNNLPDLSWQYQHDKIPTVKKRLFQAGVRLALLLNNIYE